jgi:hypothetical protein
MITEHIVLYSYTRHRFVAVRGERSRNLRTILHARASGSALSVAVRTKLRWELIAFRFRLATHRQFHRTHYTALPAYAERSPRKAAKQRRRSSAGAFGVVLSEIVLTVLIDLVRTVFVGATLFGAGLRGGSPLALFPPFLGRQKVVSQPRLEWQRCY